MICKACGFEIQEHFYEMQLVACPECGARLIRETQPLPLNPLEPERERSYGFEFTGSAGEFFRIWIINVFLTVITLGIYNAWAKVRTRQYFYANTKLAGHSFDYLANPVAILKGNLVIGAGSIFYFLGQRFSPLLSGIALVVFYLIFPFLIYQSLRFRARYSAYRGIRFRFHGTLGDSYVNYLLFPLLAPFTLGIIVPYFIFRQKRYFFDNMAFGKTRSRFFATTGRFFSTYIGAAVIGFGAYLVVFLIILLPMIRSMTQATMEGRTVPPPSSFLFNLIFFYLFAILISALIQQFIYTRINNYSWNESQLGDVKFESSLELAPLLGIRITNILAIIFSLGLAIPWARVRHARYVLEHLALTTRGDLDNFTADVAVPEGALGEAAADFFDIDIGL